MDGGNGYETSPGPGSSELQSESIVKCEFMVAIHNRLSNNHQTPTEGRLTKRTTMSTEYHTVVLLEENDASFIEATKDGGGAIQISAVKTNWEPHESITEDNPEELFDALARRLQAHWASEAVISHRGTEDKPKRVTISLPGTLQDSKTILSSSRLKIRREFDVADYLGKRQIEANIVHDVEAMAWGEFLQLELQLGIDLDEATLALILVDEGVGSKFLINGNVFKGAGVAGTIARLVVQPEGAYFSKLHSRGNLEVYASRPWLSRTVIENFNSLSENNTTQENLSEDRKRFEKKLSALSTKSDHWDTLSFAQIGYGLKISHPSCQKAVSAAEKYLGRTLHSIMTILNPHAIVLAGDAIKELPGLYDGIIEVARDLSWPNCWNSTLIFTSDDARKAQAFGAAKLGIRQSD